MKSGGFEVIIGNPHYVEMHKVTTYSLIGYLTKTVAIFTRHVSSAALLC